MDQINEIIYAGDTMLAGQPKEGAGGSLFTPFFIHIQCFCLRLPEHIVDLRRERHIPEARDKLSDLLVVG